MTFQLDTTGVIISDVHAFPPVVTGWKDLSPFAQGYVEAAFWDWNRDVRLAIQAARYSRQRSGFRHLAPETLARVIADCEAFFTRYARGDREAWNAKSAGRSFWLGRQENNGDYPADGFPPLTVQLGDDGKVRFAA